MRQIGNDVSSLLNDIGAVLTAPDSDPSVSAQVDSMAQNLFGSNATNAGIFGSDLAPAAELAVPVARAGYVVEASRISRMAGMTAATAVATRNGLKVTYRLGAFSSWRMGSYEAFAAAGKTDAQIITSAARTNVGVNSTNAMLAASSLARGRCP